MHPRAASNPPPSQSLARIGGVKNAAILCLGLVLLSPARSQAEEPSIAALLTAQMRRVFEERRGAVVKIFARDSFGMRVGSGFFVDPSGTIYTHAGIVLEAQDVVVVVGGRELPAQVLVADQRSGIALLKVEASTPFIPLSSGKLPPVATPVMLIGFPEDREVSPSIGIIAGLDREYLGQYFSTTHLRANMPVLRGQGGAPVLDMDGDAIGILVGRIDGGAACHILPIRAAEKVRRDLARFGELRPGWVGVQVEDATEPVQGSTAQVAELDPATPAAKCGLEAGDILLSVGGTPITTSQDVMDASYFLTAGDAAQIDFLRNGAKRSISVKPATHPLSPSRDVQAIAPDLIPRIRIE